MDNPKVLTVHKNKSQAAVKRRRNHKNRRIRKTLHKSIVERIEALTTEVDAIYSLPSYSPVVLDEEFLSSLEPRANSPDSVFSQATYRIFSDFPISLSLPFLTSPAPRFGGRTFFRSPSPRVV